MLPVRRLAPAALALISLTAFAPLLAQTERVPADLKPLLAKPVSEMRLVVTRYNADRQTLNANYAGPGGFNMPGGRGGGAWRRRRSRCPGTAPRRPCVGRRASRD